MMRDALALYGRYLALSLRAQLQYRAALVMQMLGHLVITGIEFLAIWALFARFGSLRGWTLPEIALMYGMVDVSFAIADAMGRGFDTVAALIKTGDFDRILVRPRAAALQLLGHELTLKRIGRLSQGLVVLAWAGHAVVSWNVGRAALLVFAIAGAVCVFVAIEVLEATAAFWTVESLEMWNAFSYGGCYAAQYPMSIYRTWFRRFFTAVVPLSCVVYLPAVEILGRTDPTGVPRWLHVVGPFAGVAFLAAAFAVWRVGVRHYTSTGS
jgi:ABC-2 type transport system permease protein